MAWAAEGLVVAGSDFQAAVIRAVVVVILTVEAEGILTEAADIRMMAGAVRRP